MNPFLYWYVLWLEALPLTHIARAMQKLEYK